MGYYISSENLVFDNGRYYVSIRFCKGNSNYSYDELLLGPCLLKEYSSLFNEYILNLYNLPHNIIQEKPFYNSKD